MAEVLVTGGTGFIGSHLTEKLVESGHRVTVLDKELSQDKLKNLESVAKEIDLVKGELLDSEILEKSVQGKKFVFHLAANSSVNRSIEEPSWSAEQNILATVRLLEAAVRHKVRRVVFSSSAAVYGYCKELPARESSPLAPASPYALEKVTGENYMRLFGGLHELDTVSLRYFNVFGPRQSADLPHPGGVTIVVKQIIKNGSSQLLGDGKQTRDMIYVDNIVKANLLAMEKDLSFKGAAYNICTGKPTVVSDLHEKISQLMGIKSKREHLPLPEGNIIDSLGDNSRAKSELDFAIEVDLEEGLKRTIEWWKEHGEGKE